MSTLKVSALAHPSALSTAFTLNSDGSVTLGPSVNLGGFASGTVMLFAQTAAPTGWTKSTTHDNKALRVVSGTASSGGTTAFTSVFASRTPAGTIANTTSTGTIANTTSTGTVGSTTLTQSQMPSHTHTPLSFTTYSANFGTPRSALATSSTNSTTIQTTGATGGGGSHDHSLTMNAHNHSLTMNAHNHTFTGTALDFAVQYVDVILASKD
jgi:microcystin-dependent protein